MRPRARQSLSQDARHRRFGRSSGEVAWRFQAVCEGGGGSDEPMPSPEEFDEALQHAQTIYDFVLNLLPTEARP